MVVLNQERNNHHEIQFMPFFNNVVNQGVNFVKGIFNEEPVYR